ncbi:MAG TPA: AMP-binding protein, partial [Zeimonas sp.]|nr:AMP-binding protein [Zeimonas sp.]
MMRPAKRGALPDERTFPALLLAQAQRRPDAPAMREKRYGIWQTFSWREMTELVRDLTCGFAEAGLARGEHLVLIGENRPRLYAAMLAAQSLGAVPVPLYQDAVASEFVFPIVNAEVAFAVVEDQEQVDKLLEIRAETPRLARIWYDEPRGLRNYAVPGLESLQSLVDAGRQRHARDPGFFLEQVRKVRPDDVAAIFFTSGTTAEPKGVVHTHASLIDRARAGARFDALDEREEVLAYLPPA